MHWRKSRRSRRRPLPRVDGRRCLPRLEELESRLAPSADVLTYHNDNSDTGQYLSETVLSPANVNVADFGKVFSTSVDGRVYAQPLYKSAVNITTGPSPGMHNVVYVATEHDSLYAIDADNGQVLWQDSFINPAAGITPVPTGDIGSAVLPEIGITGTPVIDPTSNTLYLIAYTKAVVAQTNHYRYEIHAIDITSGNEQFGGPLLFADTIYDGTKYTYVSGPEVNGTGDGSIGGVVPFLVPRQLERVSLSLVNGTIYAGFGAQGEDIRPCHGWLLGFNTADAQNRLQLAAVFNASPNGNLADFWQSGSRISSDSAGNLYIISSNGTFDSTLDSNGFPINGDYGDSILKLAVDPSSTPTHQNKNGWGLKVLDYFSPSNTAFLQANDLDLGSGGPLLLPDSAGSGTHRHLLVFGGKEGTLYLVDRDNMGKFDPNSDHVVQEIKNVFDMGFWGPSAYYNGTLYIPGYATTNNSALTFTVSNGQLSGKPTSLSPDFVGTEGATPSVSANGANGGVVWYIDKDSSQLRAYDASSLSGELYASNQAPNGRDNLGIAVRFTTPTIANGRVYAGTTNALVAYGILGNHTVQPVPPSGLKATAVSSTQVKLTWTDNSNNEDGFEIQLSLDGTNFTTAGTAYVKDTSYFLNGLQPGQGYTFRVRAFNSAGTSSFSNPASLTAPFGPITLLQFHLDGGFAQAASFVTLNGSAKLNGSMLELTDGMPNEAGSAFFNRPVDAANFNTKFSFQLLSAAADGFTFTIQGVGPTALGAAGSGLGYVGITASAAVKFDLFNSLGEGPDSTGLYTGGALPASAGSINLTPTGLNLHSGDVFNVVLSYDGAILRSTITDTNTHATATQAYAVDIPALIGGNQAFVGFTGSDGGLTATQNILNWSYVAPSITALPPQNLTAAASNGKVALQWNASAGAATYTVFRGTSPGGEGITPYATGLTTNAFTDTGATNGSTFYYQVAAVNFGGASFKSNEASATMRPAPPGGATAIAVGGGINLSWSAANGATSYNVYRATSPGGEGSTPYRMGLTSTSFADAPLPSGATFYYQVTAVNAAGESGKSSETSATLTPAAPAGVTAQSGFGQVVLSWATSAGATSYNVYRATSSGTEGGTPYKTGLTSTSLTDLGLASGASYFYKVTAVNAGGESSTSGEVVGTTIPAAPIGLQAATSGTQITLTWTPAAGATAYNVYRSTSANGEGGTPYKTGLIGTTFTDLGLPSGAIFYYQVTAVDSAGESIKSKETSATLVPATPTGITAQGGFGQVVLSWSASSGATSYNVYRATSSGAEGTTPYKIGLTGTSLTDTGLASGVTYSYQVTALDAGGESNKSSERSGITAAAPPLGLAASGAGTQISLSWAPSNGAASYNVYRATSPGGEGSTPYRTGLASTSFTDASLPSGTTFYYRVTAVNAGGESGKSSETSATLIPAAPNGVTAQGGFGQVVLSWSASAGATSYNVYRATSSGAEGSTPFMTGLTSISLTDLGLASGANYFYKVTAVNAGGESSPSSEVVGTTIAVPPTGLQAAASGTQITLTWTPSAGATAYNVYRSTTAHGEGGTPYKTGLTGTTFTDLALSSGATLYYQVTAVDAAGESAKSNETSATLLPAAPIGVVAQGVFGHVVLSWTASLGAASYDVYRATSSGAEGGTPYKTGLTSTSFTDTGLSDGVTYFYQVTALDAGGESNKSSEVSGAAPVAAPLGLAASFAGPQISLKWSPSNGATSYNVYRATSPGGEGSTPYRMGLTGTSFIDAALPSGATFYYQVTAINVRGESAKSNEISATLIPAAPTGVTAQGGFGQVVLSWSASFGTTSYNVYRATTSGGEGTTPFMTGLNSTSLTDLGLASGASYFYEVTAVNAGGESSMSSEVVGTTIAVPPIGLQAATSGNQITLTWTPSVGATAYNVYRSTTAHGEGGTPYKTGLTATTFSDPGLSRGATFYYQVTAVNAGGESGKSNETFATLIPASPTGVTAQGGFGQVALSWSASSGATGYNVYRATSSGTEGGTPYKTGLTSTSFTDTGLASGVTYFYQVTALDAGGESAKSTESSSITAAAPPLGLAASVAGPRISLNWSPSNGAASYNLYRATSPGGEGSSPYQSGLTVASFTDLGVVNGTTYFYKVTAVNAAGESGKSSEASGTLLSKAPATVTAQGGFGQINLSWSASFGATSYNVFRATSSGGEGSIPYRTAITGTSLTDLGVASGATYFYQVTAVNSEGVGVRSREVAGTVVAVPPIGFQVSAAGANTVLTWTPSAGATSYNVYRATSSRGEGNVPYKTGLTGTSLTDNAVVSGATYFYQVTAVNAGGESGKSNETFATLIPAVPTGITAQGGFGKVALSWSASSGATSYNVYRATSSGAEGGRPYKTGLSSTSFTDTGLASGAGFFYKVTAVNAGGESNESGEASGATIALPPSTVKAAAAGTGVALTWSASVGAVSYNVYRATSSRGEGATPYKIGVTGISLTDLGVASGATYFYQITAVNAGGESGKSPEASITLAPSSPQGVTSTARAGQISLTWQASAGATSYNIYRASGSQGEGSTPYRTAVTGTSFTDAALASGATFFYRVTAVNAGGQSNLSNEVVGTVPLLDLSAGFGGTGSLVTLNGSAKINGAFLQLTDGGPSEAASAFASSRLDVRSFNTQFSFQLQNATADGFTFTIQGTAPTALGQAGAELGYGSLVVGGAGGIANSVAIKFDLHNNAGEGNDSTGLYTNAASPTTPATDLTSTGIDLHSGHIFNVTMNYGGGILKVGITDAVTGASAAQFYVINIPAIVGNSTAFVGFTGATGSLTATQQILGWTYSPPMKAPPVPIGVGVQPGAGTVLIAWASSAGATSYNLYRSTSPGGEGATPYRAGITSPSFTDSGLAGGVTYYYQVTAVDFAGESGRSAEVTAPVHLAAPINVSSNTTQMPAAFVNDISLASPNRGTGPTTGGNLDNTTNPLDGRLPDSFTPMQAPTNPNVSWDIAVPDGVLSSDDSAAIVVGQVFNLPSITRQTGKPRP
jgi:fibronectin type 3 domain-containing protein